MAMPTAKLISQSATREFQRMQFLKTKHNLIEFSRCWCWLEFRWFKYHSSRRRTTVGKFLVARKYNETNATAAAATANATAADDNDNDENNNNN